MQMLGEVSDEEIAEYGEHYANGSGFNTAF
jgi:hypothetical protein